MQKNQRQLWSRSTFTGGVMQASVVATLITLPFLPPQVSCWFSGASSCIKSYTPVALAQTDLIVYVAPGIIGILGIVVAATSHTTNKRRACYIRWSAAVVNGLLTCFTISFGLGYVGFLFLPGTLLILFSAVSCCRQAQSS